MFKLPKRDSRGFSLIELAVVVAIIGILAAIAIPTFLGQREGAQDRQAHSNLRNIAVQGKATAASNNSQYPGADSDALAVLLAEDEPALTLAADTGAPAGELDSAIVSTDADEISVNRVDDNIVIYAALSDSGTCWFALDNLEAGTFYGVDEDFTGDCDASAGDASTTTIIGADFASASEVNVDAA